MLKIGEFSRLSQVTIDSLHHYDEIGLFQPAYIDPASKYRYYTLEQLPHIHRIMALKELGLSLEQIGSMVNEELDAEEIRGMLHLKQAELQQQVRDAQRRLGMVEFRLRMLVAEKTMPDLDVVVKRLPSLRVLVMTPQYFQNHEDVAMADRAMAAALGSIQRAVASGDIKFNGTSLSIYRGDQVPHFPIPDEGWLIVDDDQTQDVTLDDGSKLTLREEPVIEEAATLMLPVGDGPVVEWHTRTALVLRWAVVQRYQPTGPIRMYHYRGPLQSLDPAEWVTELQIPIEATE